MARTDPVDLDDAAQPNRWPLAIAVSVFLHVVIICEVVVAIWPTGVQTPTPPAPVTPLAAVPIAPASPIATPNASAVGVASVPEQGPPSSDPVAPLPSAARQTTALAPPPTDRPRDRLRPPREASEPAIARAGAPARHARAHHGPAMGTQARPTSGTLPARPIARQPDDMTPAYASLGDWVRALSRMRHGDFAPRRAD